LFLLKQTKIQTYIIKYLIILDNHLAIFI